MQAIRHQLWIVLAAGIVLFTNLGGPALFDEDEPKNAECAREMLARGDWVTPTFNEELRTHKPILLYWLTMTAYQVFGVTEFAARIWSALFGLGTALVIYHLGRALFSAEVGLWSGIVLCTALMFDAVSRAATPCATLIFFSTLAMLAFVQGVAGHRQRAVGGAGDSPSLDIDSICLPDRWHSFALMYLAMGLAVLAKGPVGVVLPVGVLGLFVLCCGARDNSDLPREKWWQTLARTFAPVRLVRAAWSLRPLTGLAIVCAVAMPWYIAVGIKTEGQWLAGFLGTHNVGRFLQPMEGHRGPIFYHLVTILAGFFPWSIFLPLSLVKASQQTRSRTEPRWGYIFALCWAGVYIGFFSLAQTKLPNYVLPAYPALAMLTAAMLVRWQKQPDLIGKWLARIALIALALTGVGMITGVVIAAHLLLPGNEWLGLIGLVPLTGAAIAAWHWRQGSSRRVVQCFAVMAVVLATSIFALGSAQVSRHQNSPQIARLAREASPGQRQIATYEFYAPSLMFYAQQRVIECRSVEQVRDLFGAGVPVFLVTCPDSLPELAAVLPADVQVLSRQPRFLRKGELLLLGRRTERETAEVADRPAQPRR